MAEESGGGRDGEGDLCCTKMEDSKLFKVTIVSLKRSENRKHGITFTKMSKFQRIHANTDGRLMQPERLTPFNE